MSLGWERQCTVYEQPFLHFPHLHLQQALKKTTKSSTNRLISSVSTRSLELVEKKQNTGSSYLYKAVYHCLGTFGQSHPATQITPSCLLAVNRGRGHLTEADPSSHCSPWWGRTCGKCSLPSEKKTWGQWRIQSMKSGSLLRWKQRQTELKKKANYSIRP